MFDVLVRLSEKAGTSLKCDCHMQKEKRISSQSHASAGQSRTQHLHERRVTGHARAPGGGTCHGYEHLECRLHTCTGHSAIPPRGLLH